MFRIFLVLVLSFICIGSIKAQNLYVDSASSCSNCAGLSWATAFTSLQNAISIASGGDTIFVAKGTYYPDEGSGISNNDRNVSFEIPDSVILLGGYHSQTGYRNWETNITVLSGEIQQDIIESNNSYHVVITMNVSNKTFIEGFTISHGCSNSSAWPNYYGGGWRNDGLSNTQSSPIIQNCIFKNNYATDGGAIHSSGNSAIQLINCFFFQNSAIHGGAFYVYSLNNNYNLNITNCTFAYNTAQFGGAIYTYATNNNYKLIIRNSIFWGNYAQNFFNGHQIYNYSNVYQYPVFTNCNIQGCNGSSNWYYSIGTNGGNNIDLNPLFIDTIAGNFRFLAVFSG